MMSNDNDNAKVAKERTIAVMLDVSPLFDHQGDVSLEVSLFFPEKTDDFYLALLVKWRERQQMWENTREFVRIAVTILDTSPNGIDLAYGDCLRLLASELAGAIPALVDKEKALTIKIDLLGIEIKLTHELLIKSVDAIADKRDYKLVPDYLSPPQPDETIEQIQDRLFLGYLIGVQVLLPFMCHAVCACGRSGWPVTVGKKTGRPRRCDTMCPDCELAHLRSVRRERTARYRKKVKNKNK